jgi:hypothetical protein
MLGLGSWEAALAFWLCILSAIGCVAYGYINWNNNGTPDTVSIDDLLPDSTSGDCGDDYSGDCGKR